MSDDRREGETLVPGGRRQADRLVVAIAALAEIRQLADWHVGDNVDALRTRLACIGAKCADLENAKENGALPPAGDS
jgi:hypothetical protein